MDEPTCTVPDCSKPLRNKTATLCGMHYHRQYRHGSVDMVATTAGITASYGRRYRTIYVPGHPIADKGGKTYEHRFVLYEKIGAGPHPCHWCSVPLEWVAKGEPNCLTVDHLDNRGDNNDPSNLVPSCQPCNGARGSARRRQALLEAGWWSENDTVARLRNPAQQRRAA